MVVEGFSLTGKVAIIGGLGQSWQKEMAGYLAEAGAEVALFGKDEEQLSAGVKKVQELGKEAMAITADVTSYQQVEKMVQTVLQKWQRIDILVNSFNLPFAKPLVETDPDEWQKAMRANSTPVFICTRAVGKHMLERKEGKVINITSGLAERGLPNGTAYCTGKGAVVQFTRALALEWARCNVQVNAIALGWMADTAETHKKEWQDSLAHLTSLKRLGQPDDLACALVYLASDSSSFVTGSTFYLTGGLMAHG
jgi:NAD(P)-dependent dehydrogenase (short-subunit alcohol dehydrogenase family)